MIITACFHTERVKYLRGTCRNIITRTRCVQVHSEKDTVLTNLRPTSTAIGKRPCGRALEKPDGSEYPYLLDDSYFGYFDHDAEIKVDLTAKTSVFYIFENDKLVCVVAPIRRKK